MVLDHHKLAEQLFVREALYKGAEVGVAVSFRLIILFIQVFEACDAHVTYSTTCESINSVIKKHADAAPNATAETLFLRSATDWNLGSMANFDRISKIVAKMHYHGDDLVGIEKHDSPIFHTVFNPQSRVIQRLCEEEHDRNCLLNFLTKPVTP